MERPSIWLMLVILLAAILFLREPRLQRYDEAFLRWLLRNSPSRSGIVPLTIVDIGRSAPLQKKRLDNQAAEGGATPISPVEFALFLQAAMEFKPSVVGFEPILQWQARDKDQEQIFLDQAMRVPKLLLAAELTATPDLDAPVMEVQGFQNVTGRRGALPEFSGISRQPEEDVRLISTLGFVNLPRDVTSDLRVPLLFLYRGEVIPSFALQAAMLWMRTTPAEVKIDLGSYIFFPDGRKIPIREDGTALISPYEIKRARQLNLNELLLAAQQHETKSRPASPAENVPDEIILTRTPGDQQQSQDAFAAAIATIQANSFVRRASWIFDCVFILVLVVASGVARKFSRLDIILAAIALTAAYCLVALTTLSRWSFWLPGVLPLGTIWLAASFCLFAPRHKDDPDLPAVAPPPPSP
jgi:CHASE2 domain